MGFAKRLLILTSMAIAVNAQPAPTPQPLFDKQDLTLAITFDLPFTALTQNLSSKPEYEKATLRYDGGEIQLSVDIRTRGKTRRNKSVCRFPPLRVRFNEADTEGTLFENQKALKLVTHCNNKQGYEQYVLLEYLGYRIYNLLSDHGLRVRLVKANYVEGKRTIVTRYGFFLENWRKVAERNGVTTAEIQGGVDLATLSVPDVNRVAVFQYLIGNDDWSVTRPETNEACCHNIKLLKNDEGRVIPLPYDFDYSGLVDAPYAVSKSGNTNVRKRRYSGLCFTQTDLSETLPLFRERSPAIYELIENLEGLSDRNRNRTKAYVDRFYAVINNPDSVQKKLVNKCRKK